MFKLVLSCLLLIFLVASCSMNIGANKYEEPSYKVIDIEDNYELRQYEPYLVAATLVEGNFDDVGSEGFQRLFKYITGDNRARQSISMTAPVTQEGKSEKISMTAPVSQENVAGKWQITFMMPSEYTLDTLPKPIDPNVVIKTVPSRLMASIRYSGTWSRKRYNEHEKKLLELIRKKGLKVIDKPVFARYNPPFAPWFLRRNEVLIPVEKTINDK